MKSELGKWISLTQDKKGILLRDDGGETVKEIYLQHNVSARDLFLLFHYDWAHGNLTGYENPSLTVFYDGALKKEGVPGWSKRNPFPNTLDRRPDESFEKRLGEIYNYIILNPDKFISSFWFRAQNSWGLEKTIVNLKDPSYRTNDSLVGNSEIVLTRDTTTAHLEPLIGARVEQEIDKKVVIIPNPFGKTVIRKLS